MQERRLKIEKIIEQLRREIEREEGFDERFTGQLTISLNLQSGGIGGKVDIRKVRDLTRHNRHNN